MTMTQTAINNSIIWKGNINIHLLFYVFTLFLKDTLCSLLFTVPASLASFLALDSENEDIS